MEVSDGLKWQMAEVNTWDFVLDAGIFQGISGILKKAGNRREELLHRSNPV